MTDECPCGFDYCECYNNGKRNERLAIKEHLKEKYGLDLQYLSYNSWKDLIKDSKGNEQDKE